MSLQRARVRNAAGFVNANTRQMHNTLIVKQLILLKFIPTMTSIIFNRQLFTIVVMGIYREFLMKYSLEPALELALLIMFDYNIPWCIL